ncbi:phosphatases II [Periconia macrospinosa]|uniref:protein-tyrosine-phosphatase n=1 Tax=Periconia macrospinosa TaxID=97972 RepID=A0A2V1D7D3_9PLEO|nr:phosphatases II [Periconia macrospinosa]
MVYQRYPTPSRIMVASKPSITRITDQLYLGNCEAAADYEILTEHNIKAVVSLMIAPRAKWNTPRYKEITTEGNHLFVYCEESMRINMLPYFANICDFISEHVDAGAVLVHCPFGVSRSATAVIAYLMHSHQMEFDNAFQFVPDPKSVVVEIDRRGHQRMLGQGRGAFHLRLSAHQLFGRYSVHWERTSEQNLAIESAHKMELWLQELLQLIQKIRRGRLRHGLPDIQHRPISGGKTVKYGEGVTLKEARDMVFVRQNTKIPVPGVYYSYFDDTNGVTFIVMDYVCGRRLDKVWDRSLSQIRVVVDIVDIDYRLTISTIDYID